MRSTPSKSVTKINSVHKHHVFYSTVHKRSVSGRKSDFPRYFTVYDQTEHRTG